MRDTTNVSSAYGYGGRRAPSSTLSSFMMGKMELRKCEDVQKWRQDDTPPVGLHFQLQVHQATAEPRKKREKINELVHKIEQISLCTSRAARNINCFHHHHGAFTFRFLTQEFEGWW